MKRTLVLLYGIICYLGFLAVFLYLIGFLMDVGVPKAINDGETAALMPSLLTNIFLVALFGLQHSIMARPTFKRIWTTIVPEEAERSTFVLFTVGCLVALYAYWQPIPETVWDFRGGVIEHLITGTALFGWGLVLISTFVIDHFSLFGLKQVVYNFVGREMPECDFVVRGPYHFCRHPLMLGFLIAFWAAPWMTVGHLLFAIVMTVYVLIALHYEERNLLQMHGSDYERYKQETSMLIPFV